MTRDTILVATMIVMYESNRFLKAKIEKTERVPDEEFIPIKRRAIVFLKAKQYSVDVIKHFEETPYVDLLVYQDFHNPLR